MPQVNIHETRTHLSRLIDEALSGKEVVIAIRHKPLVRLDVLPEAKPQRRLGGAKGMIISMSDDFNEPLAG